MFVIAPQPRTRKAVIITMAILIGVCIILAGVFFIYWAKDQETLKQYGQPDFNTLSAEQLKDGMFVKGNIDLAFDTFAEEYETNYGIRTSKNSSALYYLVPIYDMDQEGQINIHYFVTFEADPKVFDTMDKILKQTWDVNAPLDTKLEVKNAVIRNLPDKLKTYQKEWAEDPGFYEKGSFIDWCVEYNIFGTDDKETIRSKLVPIIVDQTDTTGTDLNILWFLGGTIALCTILMLVFIFRKKPIKGYDPPDYKAPPPKDNEMHNL